MATPDKKRQRTDVSATMRDLQGNNAAVFPVMESLLETNQQLEDMIYQVDLLDTSNTVIWSGDLRTGHQQILKMDLEVNYYEPDARGWFWRPNVWTVSVQDLTIEDLQQVSSIQVGLHQHRVVVGSDAQPWNYDYDVQNHKMKINIPFINQRWHKVIHKNPHSPCEEDSLKQFGTDYLGEDGFYLSGIWSCTDQEIRAEFEEPDQDGVFVGYGNIREDIASRHCFPGANDYMVVDSVHLSISGYVQRILKLANLYDDDEATFKAIQEHM